MRYALVQAGKVSNVVVGEGLGSPFIACPASVGIGWSYDGSSFSPPIPAQTWTSFEFLQRFTAAERDTIRRTANLDAALADFLLFATAAQEIHSTDPVTVGAMDYLVSLGILTPARRAEILS
jgi:hypothetical protein